MCRTVGFIDFNFNNSYSLEETITLNLEKKLFGNLDKLKTKLKNMVLGDERKARVYGVEEL